MDKEEIMQERDFQDQIPYGGRKGVCKRCHCVMVDREESCWGGEFNHPLHDKEGKPHWCRNAGLVLEISNPELEPFLRKRDRRRNKRTGIRP